MRTDRMVPIIESLCSALTEHSKAVVALQAQVTMLSQIIQIQGEQIALLRRNQP